MSKNKQKAPLSKKIVTYSIAASGALAIGAQVDAAPQYSGAINETVSDDSFIIDIDGVTPAEFEFINFQNFNSGNYLYFNPTINLMIHGEIETFNSQDIPLASRFTTSQQIGPGSNWGKYFVLGEKINEDSFEAGNFLGKTGFIGVQFQKGNNTHYGWIHFEGPNTPTYGKIIDWGYESEPDTPILAGAPKYTQPTKTHTIPTLNEWGMLILMALILEEGLRRMRREKDTLVQLVEIS